MKLVATWSPKKQQWSLKLYIAGTTIDVSHVDALRILDRAPLPSQVALEKSQKRRYTRRTLSQKRKLVKAYDARGDQDAAEWCREHGVSSSVLHRFRKDLKRD